MKKRFFSQTAGSLGSGEWGIYRLHGVLEFSCFCCHQPSPVHRFSSVF